MRQFLSHSYTLLSFFFLVLPFGIQAQKEIAYFQDFTLQDGLSSTNVNLFFQDSRGIIWIGTSYGLNSYDGTSFKSYTKEDNGLCHNYIKGIAEDGKGNLWIQSGDFGRRNIYYCILNPITEAVYSIEEYTGEPCPFNPNYTFFNSNYKGTFILQEWMTGNQIQFYEIQGDKIEKGITFLDKDTIFHWADRPRVYKIDKETYIATSVRTLGNEKPFISLCHIKPSGLIIENILDATPINAFHELDTDGQHLYYLYSTPSYVSFYKDGQIEATIKVNRQKDRSFLVKDNLYKFYHNHIEKYKLLGDSVVYDQRINTDRNVDELVRRNFVDRGGNIWLASNSEIIKLSFRPQKFNLYLNQTYGGQPRPIRGIDSHADGTMYIGDYYALSIKKPNGKLMEDIPPKGNKRIGNLGLIHDGNQLWVGSEAKGLCLYDIKTKERFYYGSGLIWQPYKAPDNTIWVGAEGGLFKFDPLKKDLIPFQDYGEYVELGKSAVYAFFPHEKGTWLSTSSGMYLVDLTQEKVLAHYSDTQAAPYYIPANHIAHIHEDQEGIFWLATKGQGLIRWNPVTGKSEQLTRGNTELSHNVLYAVYEDDFGNLWLPSDYGLNCLNKKSRQVSLYLTEDGLPHYEFNTVSHYQDKKGNLYFGTVDGMIAFHPKDFNQESENIPFIITRVNRVNQQTDSLISMTKTVLDQHALTIEPTDKAAEINFALLDYSKTDGNQYAYKIEGYQDKWNYQKEGKLRISGLPYGHYRLLLRGKTSGNYTWINYPHPIHIHVIKPFYLQWWFILSSLLIIGGLVFYLFRRNTRKLLKRQQELETIVTERTEEIRLQAEELKQLDKVKSRFFANISHELRTPLTLILGPLSYILDNPDAWEKQNVQQQLRVMQRNGKSLMELIEEILDLSKLEANKLELSEEGTPVAQFFEYIFFVFEPQFKSQNLNYQLKLDIRKGLHVLIDRKKLEKVLKNFLSNAIKFTPQGGTIILNVKETDSQLKIEVSDTGKGIHPKDLPHIFERFYQSKQADQKLYGGTGIGLALVNEFAQLMGGKAFAQSTLGVGSTFFFELPKKEVAQNIMLDHMNVDLSEKEEIQSIGSNFTIMVVEDNPDMREFIYQLLQKKYKKILLAKNGAEGLALLGKHRTDIHLIVSDIMMPEVDGLTMLKKIKRNTEWSGIPVVMLTALAGEQDKLTALTIGVDDYLTKPFSVPELLIRVQNLLFNYHQRQKWQRSTEFQEQQEIFKRNISQAEAQAKDKEWVDKLIKLIEGSINESKLDVESLAVMVHLSSRQLNRKLKAITGLSPAKFIKEVRLQVARRKLEKGTSISVAEAAYGAGFDNLSTFSFVFKSRFGKSPSEYLKTVETTIKN